MPEIYQDDKLMQSLISRYSIEGNTDGVANGKFYLNKEGARAVSTEVVHTHLFGGAKGDQFVNEKFDGVWNYFDVNHDGFLVVQVMPQFLRMIVGEPEAALGLQ